MFKINANFSLENVKDFLLVFLYQWQWKQQSAKRLTSENCQFRIHRLRALGRMSESATIYYPMVSWQLIGPISDNNITFSLSQLSLGCSLCRYIFAVHEITLQCLHFAVMTINFSLHSTNSRIPAGFGQAHFKIVREYNEI